MGSEMVGSAGWLTIALLAAAYLAVGCAPGDRTDIIFKRQLPEQARRDLERKVARIVEPYVTSPNNLALVVGLIKDGSALVLGYGKISAESDLRPDDSTLFEIGSITKVFTTALLAEMVAAGQVRMDEPVEKLLPASAAVPSFKGKKITLFHLATHTSGLPRVPDNLFKSAEEMKDPYANYTPRRLYAFLSNHKLRRAPGEKYEYSNVGMGLLGHALALRSGLSYEEAVVGRLCKKLGMTDTRCALSPAQQKRLAPGHGHLGMPAGYWSFDAVAGAGCLRSSASDMLRFLAANLGMSAGRLSEVVRSCHRPRVKTGQEKLAVGLGWHIFELGDQPDANAVWHNGGTGGFASWTGFFRDSRTAVVVLSNSTGSVDVIGLDILLLLNQPPRPQQKPKPPAGPQAGAQS